MKITLYAKPRFTFEMDEMILRLLIELSQAHYSYDCKNLGKVPSGKLYWWKCAMDSHDYYPVDEDIENGEDVPEEEREYKPFIVHATFQELDIISKILELRRAIPGYTEYQRNLLNDFANDIRLALTQSNDIIKPWRQEINGTSQNTSNGLRTERVQC